jgi:preprotein translocase subunit SecA
MNLSPLDNTGLTALGRTGAVPGHGALIAPREEGRVCVDSFIPSKAAAFEKGAPITTARVQQEPESLKSMKEAPAKAEVPISSVPVTLVQLEEAPCIATESLAPEKAGPLAERAPHSGIAKTAPVTERAAQGISKAETAPSKEAEKRGLGALTKSESTLAGTPKSVLPQAIRSLRRLENKLLSFVGLDDPVEEMRFQLDEINALEPKIQALTDDELKAETEEFKARLAKGENMDDMIVEAYAVAREASRRVTGMRHFDVQVLGGIALYKGKVAEMATGEGKTLTEVLPVYLNALSGKGVHVVTVNDTLAKRDSQWMGKIFEFMGLTVGCVTEGMAPQEKRAAYNCDITYMTNATLGFDYLRDNLARSPEERVQRAPNYALVDEVDEILIDEARTPLIVSQFDEPSTKDYTLFADVVKKLKPGEDFKVNYKERHTYLTDEGLAKVEKMIGVGNLYSEENLPLVHYLQASLVANNLYFRDKDYIVEDGKVDIVDEFTGRIMDGRRYNDGVHQALEAKEGVEIHPEQKTLASITYPNLFRRYPRLAGMSGTAKTEDQEFHELYGLEVVRIPTNKPVIRKDLPDQLYKSQEEKFAAILGKVEDLYQEGQPVLIGTRSVIVNEYLHGLLDQRGIPHQLLNAKSVKDNTQAENDIIAQAGHCGMVTLATNMAGRGVDIKPDLVNFKKMTAVAYGELQQNKPVLAVFNKPAEREEFIKWLDSNEIPHSDVKPGETVSVRPAEVGIMVREKGVEAPRFDGADAAAPDAERPTILLADDFPTGGLFVLGTERHESRRIDNQLKGRSGRQGNPGVSQFFVSLDDEILHLFGGEKMKGIFNGLGIRDGEPLSGGLVDKAVESAQKKIEGIHFGIRKDTTKFDGVLSRHRDIIYAERKNILEGYDLESDTLDWIKDYTAAIVERHGEKKIVSPQELKAINEECRDLFGFLPIRERDASLKISREKLSGLLNERVRDRLYGVLRSTGRAQMREIQKQAMLRAIDERWFAHLAGMEEMQQGIGLVAYAEQDPWLAYQKRSYELFDEMKQGIITAYLSTVFSSGAKR